jgi:hypothetical protein
VFVTAALLACTAVGPASTKAQAATVAVPATTITIGGALQPGFGTTAPTTLQILTVRRGMVTVNVSPSTTLVRRYNGPSALNEFSPGDQLKVTGVMLSNNTFNATLIKNNTIQHAYTHNLAVITAINSTTTLLTVRVLRDLPFDNRVAPQNPFAVGQTIFVAVTPAMSVTLADGSRGTVQDDLSAGLTIATLGVYNRSSRTFQPVWRLRVVSPTPGTITEFGGILQPGFATAAPTTLTLSTPFRGMVTVQVSPTTVLVRRYNGPSSLAEFSAGDNLRVTATFLGGSTYSAIRVKDATIQQLAIGAVGQIDTINGNVITMTVLAGGTSPKSPFRPGQVVTFTLSPHTVITLANGATGTPASLQSGMRINVLGVYDRNAHSFVTVDRVHILS